MGNDVCLAHSTNNEAKKGTGGVICSFLKFNCTSNYEIQMKWKKQLVVIGAKPTTFDLCVQYSTNTAPCLHFSCV